MVLPAHSSLWLRSNPPGTSPKRRHLSGEASDTHPLSRPFCPSFFPMSPTITPGMGSRVFGSRICPESQGIMTS